MTDRELMQQALKALEEPHEHIFKHRRLEAIVALKKRLAQPEQEPVAWLEPEWGEKICLEAGFEYTITSDHPKDLCWVPLYTAPPQREWIGLTDEEVWEMEAYKNAAPYEELRVLHRFARVIEAKLREKNNA